MRAKATEKYLFDDFSLHPVIASEIEFYLFDSETKDLSLFWDEIRAACAKYSIKIYNIEKERGKEQYEVSLFPERDVEKIIRDTDLLKKIICDIAKDYNLRADFSAKPLADDFGSGLHIHIHLENEHGKNLFFKNDDSISDELYYSLGGLLLWLADTMPFFAPRAESYKRFVAGKNAPLTVSWGANNRTVALRLPDSTHDNKRIEHRVSGADADTGQVVSVIFAAIHYGIKNKCKPSEQYYGDATLAGCKLSKLAENFDEALRLNKKSLLPFTEYGLLT